MGEDGREGDGEQKKGKGTYLLACSPSFPSQTLNSTLFSSPNLI